MSMNQGSDRELTVRIHKADTTRTMQYLWIFLGMTYVKRPALSGTRSQEFVQEKFQCRKQDDGHEISQITT